MTVFHLSILIIGLAGLIIGAELLVRKGSLLAKCLGIHPFFVGVILLGMGTSAPEWAVSTISSIKGLPNLAVSNVFGSNIFNILLVLGLILFRPLSQLNINLIKKDILFLFFSGFALIPLMFNYFLSRWDAFVLTIIFLAYIAFSSLSAQKQKASLEVSSHQIKIFFPKEILFIILGFVLLIGGSHFTVIGASYLGQKIGMSERLIGILIVSVGTSLPELFASITALLKEQKDMAIGNIIGSNIFNTFAILGTAAWILPANIDTQMFTIDLPVLMAIHIILFSLLFCYKIQWIQKILPYLFFSGYICYMSFLLFAR